MKKSEIAKKEPLQKEQNFQLQSNDISNGIYNCTANARRLIAFCISNAYKDSKEMAIVYKNETLTEKDEFPCMKSTFTFAEFFNRMGMTYGSQQIELIKKAVNECTRAVITIEQKAPGAKKGKIYNFTWFSSSVFDEENEKVTMVFNPYVYKAIVAWYFSNNGYSALSLELLGNLKSFYAMRYYEMAISQMGNMGKSGNEPGEWWFEYSIDELKTIFNLHETKSYERTENFIQKVVQQPIDELNSKNPDFKIEVQKIKERRKTIGFHFLCTAEKKSLPKTSSKTVQNNPYTAICPVCGTRTSLFYPCVFCDFDMNEKDNAKLVNIKKQIFNMPKEKREMFEADCRAIESKILEKFTKTPGNLAVLEESKNLISAVYQKYNISE